MFLLSLYLLTIFSLYGYVLVGCYIGFGLWMKLLLGCRFVWVCIVLVIYFCRFSFSCSFINSVVRFLVLYIFYSVGYVVCAYVFAMSFCCCRGFCCFGFLFVVCWFAGCYINLVLAWLLVVFMFDLDDDCLGFTLVVFCLLVSWLAVLCSCLLLAMLYWLLVCEFVRLLVWFGFMFWLLWLFVVI